MNKRHKHIVKMLADDMGAPQDVMDEVVDAFEEAEQHAYWLQAHVLPLVMQNTLSKEQSADHLKKMHYIIEATELYASLRFGVESAKLWSERQTRG